MIRTLMALFVFVAAQETPKPPVVEKPKETEAEAFLRKVEEKAVKAKSIKYKTKIVMAMGQEEITFAGEGSFKESDKFKLSMEGEMMGKAMQVAVVSDGKNVHIDGEGGPTSGEATTVALPKDAGEGTRLCLVRLGSLIAMFYGDKKFKEKEGSIKDIVTVSAVKFDKEEKVGERAAKVLTYTITIEDKNDTGEIKLWVDAETLAPLKREINTGNGQTMTETFSTWSFDEEIKDDVFTLPKTKDEKKEEPKKEEKK
jgi:outer membrane lipoprotein-sorting protein